MSDKPLIKPADGFYVAGSIFFIIGLLCAAIATVMANGPGGVATFCFGATGIFFSMGFITTLARKIELRLMQNHQELVAAVSAPPAETSSEPSVSA